MKKILTLSFVFLLAVTGRAQFTLTYATHGYANGDIFNFHEVDSVGPGPSGASQTWNYSTLRIHDTLYTETYLTATPSITAAFPASNLVMVTNSSDSTFYRSTADTLQVMGLNYGSMNTGRYKFTNSDVVLTFPYSFTSPVINDAFSSSSNGGSGTSTTTMDGHGTLVLSSGSYPVDRLHYSLSYTFNAGNPPFVVAVTFFMEEYTWLRATTKYPLLKIRTTEVTSAVGGIPKETKVYMNDNVTSVKENNSFISGLSVFPNPGSDKVYLEIPVSKPLTARISVNDLSGREVIVNENESLKKGNNLKTLDVSGVSKGIYLVRVVSENETTTQKIVIE